MPWPRVLLVDCMHVSCKQACYNSCRRELAAFAWSHAPFDIAPPAFVQRGDLVTVPPQEIIGQQPGNYKKNYKKVKFCYRQRLFKPCIYHLCAGAPGCFVNRTSGYQVLLAVWVCEIPVRVSVLCLNGALSTSTATSMCGSSGWALSYYSRYTYSSHSFGYSFSFSLKVLGVRAIVLGFRVRVRIRGLGDQNYEVEFETIGTVTQNYANFDYSGYFSHCLPAFYI